ncbi:MAG: transcription antitermination factor NusB, partial [Trueperaceae bacterium]|nr:transcription antitermination factor NusB [Trueperaceae bacterium]
MTPPAPPATARDATIAALTRVLADGERATVALDRALGAVAPGAERALATGLVYGTLRWLPALDAALAPHLRDAEALPLRVRLALRVGAYERAVRGTPPHAAVHAWVDLVKRSRGPERALAGLVNAVLRRVDLADPRVTADPAAAVALPPAL